MADKNATLKLPDGRSLDFPVLSGTMGPDVVDIRALYQELLDVIDRLGRVQVLRADVDAIHDGVAAKEAIWILEVVEPLAGRLVATVDNPAVGLQQRSGAKIAFAVPPIARARR